MTSLLLPLECRGAQPGEPPTRFDERVVGLAEAEAQLRAAGARVAIEATARHRRHLHLRHQEPSTRDIV